MTRFRGMLTFVFDEEDDSAEFIQDFHEGTAGQASDWPQKFNLGDVPFDSFKVTNVKINGNTATLKFEFTRENTSNLPHSEFVSAVKEDFESLEGVDTAEWYIENASASVLVDGGRRRKTRRAKHVRKTKRRY